MRHLAARGTSPSTDIGAEIRSDPDEFGRLLAPVVAGARARGIADAFELMELAAILMDGAGRVLHAGGRAERILLPLVRIVDDHLIGCDAGTNRRIQAAIQSGLRRGDTLLSAPNVLIEDADGQARLSLRVIVVPQDRDHTSQLLRAILVVSDVTA